MKCKKARSGVTTCTVGKRTFTLHPGKSNHAAKVRRGKALHRKFKCTRNKRSGQIVSCAPRRGK
jgi:hypothetical protein